MNHGPGAMNTTPAYFLQGFLANLFATFLAFLGATRRCSRDSSRSSQ